MNKASMRELVLAARDAVPAAVRDAHSSSACARLLDLLRARHAGLAPARPLVVASFVAFRTELDTACLNEALLRDPHRFTLALPRVARPRQLQFFAVRDLDAAHTLQRSKYGILEPRDDPAVNAPLAADQIDVFVTPGVAFDTAGRRLGHGGGFYDCLFNALPAPASARAIALAFECQIVERVPVEPHDACVGQIVTETRVIEAQPQPPAATTTR